MRRKCESGEEMKPGVPISMDGPRASRSIDGTNHNQRQLPEELAMLFKHEIADDALAERLHFVAHANTRLHCLLAAMKR